MEHISGDSTAQRFIELLAFCLLASIRTGARIEASMELAGNYLVALSRLRRWKETVNVDRSGRDRVQVEVGRDGETMTVTAERDNYQRTTD